MYVALSFSFRQKFFIDSIIMDLAAMEKARRKKQAEQVMTRELCMVIFLLNESASTHEEYKYLTQI